MKIIEVWGTPLQDVDFDEAHWLSGNDTYHDLSARRAERDHENHVCFLTRSKRRSARREKVAYEFFPVTDNNTSSDLLEYINDHQPHIVLLHSLNAYQSWLCLEQQIPGTRYIIDSNSAATNGPMIDRIAASPEKVSALIFKTPLIRDRFCAVTGYPFEQTAAIPSGINIHQFRPLSLKREIDCVWVGYMRKNNWRKKNIPMLTEVLSRLPFHHYVIGGGSELPAFQQSAPPDVLCTGEVTRSHLIKLLNQSKIMLHTSSYDPAPRAVSEALACGLPVVGLKQGWGTEQQIIDGINGFRVDSVEEMVAAVNRLLASDSLQLKMGTASREIAKSAFNVDRIDLQLEEFFEKWL